MIYQEICVDASFALRWIVPGQRWQRKAARLLNDAADADVRLIAPPLFEYEVESTIQRYVYDGSLFTAQADTALVQIEAIGVESVSAPLIAAARAVLPQQKYVAY